MDSAVDSAVVAVRARAIQGRKDVAQVLAQVDLAWVVADGAHLAAVVTVAMIAEAHAKIAAVVAAAASSASTLSSQNAKLPSSLATRAKRHHWPAYETYWVRAPTRRRAEPT